MRPYRLIEELDWSENSQKDIAMKFDAGKVHSDRYGAASLRGQLLLLHRDGAFPEVKLKQVEEMVIGWLEEMSMLEYRDFVFQRCNIPSMCAYTAPGTSPEKQELLFKYYLFVFFVDDDTPDLKLMHENDRLQLQQDTLRSVNSFMSIVESRGDAKVAEKAAAENPMMKNACLALAYLCRSTFEQMRPDDYAQFMNELSDYFRAVKWEQDYLNTTYSESDYFFVRLANLGMDPALSLACVAQGIHVGDEIRRHPLCQRYRRNAVTYMALCNDLLSVKKEIADSETENLVFIKCRKYSLQKAFFKTEKVVNALIIDLKKDAIKLKSYFPADENLNNFIRATEEMVDGFFYWHGYAKRYPDMTFTKCVVEYDSDYYSWLEKMGTANLEIMKEPVLHRKK